MEQPDSVWADVRNGCGDGDEKNGTCRFAWAEGVAKIRNLRIECR